MSKVTLFIFSHLLPRLNMHYLRNWIVKFSQIWEGNVKKKKKKKKENLVNVQTVSIHGGWCLFRGIAAYSHWDHTWGSCLWTSPCLFLIEQQRGCISLLLLGQEHTFKQRLLSWAKNGHRCCCTCSHSHFIHLNSLGQCHEAVHSFISTPKPNPWRQCEGRKCVILSFQCVVWPTHVDGALRGGFDGGEWGTNELALSMAGLYSVLLMARRHQQSCWYSM